MKKNEKFLEIQGERVICQGDWIIDNADKIEKEINNIKISTPKCHIDFSKVTDFDTSGILLLLNLKKSINSCSLSGLNDNQKKILKLLEKGYSSESLPERKEGFIHHLGRKSIEELKFFIDFISFIGQLSGTFFRLILNPSNFRLKETVYHIEKSGIDALFIIALTSILVGLVIAYQTLVQLSQFGADIFVVDAIGISITRELGPMLTAIVIAGRSASSYTAEIGTMKITEEISAMRTMGFDPYFFLIIPRIIALVIALPLLIFFSDIMGILGGMIATKAQADISFTFFLERLQEVLALKHYILGLIKGPFFALIIAATGCFHGFRVTNDTESIGIETTASVVHAIFLVIAADALFSILYTNLGY